ncbi:MAG: family 78 glycoside hydrolase catalytic domain [Armatimonadetes bacterium]|nr:family 78 glycoside hydrolase catalytic domain [Armatimonadota bacterium]
MLLTVVVSSMLMKSVSVLNLRCEYQTSPSLVDVARPRLAWQLQSAERGLRQTAYQILVASSVEALKKGKGDLWDSGKVKSDESIQVPYAGASVGDNKSAFWKVRVWDQNGSSSDWSSSAEWRTGLTSWKADWIERHVKQTFAPVDPYDDDPAPLLRKSFRIEKPVASATLFVSGLGYFEPRLNGEKVGDHQLDPGWTDFSKRVSYSMFDVSKQLRQGENVLGAMLGNGWFNPLPLKMWGHLNLREHLTIGNPRLIAQLEIRYKDGSTETVASNGSWRVVDGPIIRNSVYLGEVYDARAEQRGWDGPGFDDSSWGHAKVVADANKETLSLQQTPPIRITKTLKPVRITEPKPGVYIVDYGQNFAGWTRMKVKGPAGTRIRLRSGELLYDDGTLNGMTSVAGQAKGGGKDYVYPGKGEPRTAFQIDEYVCKGEGVETFQPRFTFHGFRYVEVTGYPGKPEVADFEGERLNSDVEKVGSFECSNPMFNRIQTMVEWTLLSNIFSVESDCPHREKFGYGGDQVAVSETAMYTFDMARFYANTAHLLAETEIIDLPSQFGNEFDSVRKPNVKRGFTETAPYVGIADEGLGGQTGPIGWASAFPLLVTQLNDYYGEKRVAQDLYVEESSWICFPGLESSSVEKGISDHESLVPKPAALTGQAFKILNYDWFSRIVLLAKLPENDPRVKAPSSRDVLWAGRGKDSFAKRLQDTSESLTSEFNKRFLKLDGTYDIGTQCCQAMPLAIGLVPEDVKPKVLDVLLKDIEAHDDHLTTGIFGTKYLFEALSDNGHDDVAYRIANQKTFPSWGYMLEKGATTLWEHWDYSDNTFSHNHPMFGSVSEWFYRSLLGIRPAAPGFKKILIRPSVVGDLTYAKGHHDCPYGRIAVSWHRKGSALTLDVDIPGNTVATVIMPGQDAKTSDQTGVHVGSDGVFEVGSGRYQFTSTLK